MIHPQGRNQSPHGPLPQIRELRNPEAARIFTAHISIRSTIPIRHLCLMNCTLRAVPFDSPAILQLRPEEPFCFTYPDVKHIA